MGLIPAESLEAIRGKLDIVELVGEYVPNLQRAGRNMKGRCPFHQERTPSFIVSPERQTFHCFGCGEGGDAFAFVMKIENLSFTEAAEKLAARAGVRIEPAEESLGPEQRERLKVKELLEFAAGFYHDFLVKSPQAEAARRYLQGRKLSPASIEDFALGYAPKSSVLIEAAAKRGYPKEMLAKAGLAAPQRDTGRLRDYFYDRVLFPIRDARGAVAGFGARTMGDGQPKYLNSPDSPFFSKSRILYGLHRGLPEIRKKRRALLMEGYMDVIAAHQAGFTTACAPLGTALTPDHVALLKRYADEATLVFDADAPGLSAAVRGAELMLSAGLSACAVTVPNGKDPDEFLKQSGPEAFRKVLDSAKDLVQFKGEMLLAREAGPLTANRKAAIVSEMVATIGKFPDEVRKMEWGRWLMGALKIDEGALRAEMAKAGGVRPAFKPRAAAVSGTPVSAGLSHGDRQLLGLMFRLPRLAALAEEGDFSSPAGVRLWKALGALPAGAADWSARLLESLGAGERAEASRLLVEGIESDDPEGVLKAALARRRGTARFKELDTIIKGAGAKGVDRKVFEEYQKLVAQLKGTKRV